MASKSKWPQPGWWRQYHVELDAQWGNHTNIFFFFFFCIEQLVALQLAALEKSQHVKKKKRKTSLCYSVTLLSPCCVCECAAHIVLTKTSLHSLDAAARLPLGGNSGQHVHESVWMVKTSDLHWRLWLWRLIVEGTSAIYRAKKMHVINCVCVLCACVTQMTSNWGKTLQSVLVIFHSAEPKVKRTLISK